MSSLDDLTRDYPLPAECSPPDLFAETVQVEGEDIHLVGLSTELPGPQTVTGSAAAPTSPPLDRAYFELVERATIGQSMLRPTAEWPLKDARGDFSRRAYTGEVFPASSEPEKWQYSRSNGVALGRTWTEACQRALYELVERDRVLRSWYGEIPPTPIALPRGMLPAGIGNAYEVQAYEFGGSLGGVFVAGVFGFPRAEGAPLICGLGARADWKAALSAASSECLQRLGFLWGEELPAAEPMAAPVPDFHQEFFLWPRSHTILREWLRGDHQAFGQLLEGRSGGEEQPRLFADLTPAELAGRLAVAKAIPTAEMPLTFGLGHPWVDRMLPEALRIHPIA